MLKINDIASCVSFVTLSHAKFYLSCLFVLGFLLTGQYKEQRNTNKEQVMNDFSVLVVAFHAVRTSAAWTGTGWTILFPHVVTNLGNG